MDPNGTDALFEIIRKELNTIIETGEKKANPSQGKETARAHTKEENSPSSSKRNTTSPRATTRGQPILKKAAATNQKTITEEAVKEETAKAFGSPLFPRIQAGHSTKAASGSTDVQTKGTELTDMQTKFRSTLEKDIASQTAFLDSPRSKNIDADVQRMQMELQESYNLFQGISEKFESINFLNLQKRIQELNLSKKREAIGKQRTDELKEVVEEGFKTNRLNEMTTKVGEKFNKHPGEFGNIPELSSFFQACTQLEHVLGTLKRQRTDVRDLEERMRKSSEISYNRVSHIKKQLQEQEFDKPSRMHESNENDNED